MPTTGTRAHDPDERVHRGAGRTAREEIESGPRRRSGWFILGSEVKAFEKGWASYCGAPFCVGVGNGMDAIEIGLRAMGIGAGDEVITTPMTAIATILAIVHAGATPVLADIDPDDRAARHRERRAGAHASNQGRAAGAPLRSDRRHGSLDAFCAQKGIQLLEDCAQSHGATWNGETAGTFGFRSVQLLSDEEPRRQGRRRRADHGSTGIAEKARMLRNYGTRTRYEHPELGLNSRLDELQAAILRAAPGSTDSTRGGEPWPIAITPKSGTHVSARWPRPPRARATSIICSSRVLCRDRLARTLRDNGIETPVHYPIAAHRQESLTGIRCDPRGLPHAERHADECLSIPCHPQLTDDEVRPSSRASTPSNSRAMLRRVHWYAAAPILAAMPVINAAKLYSASVPISLGQVVRDCVVLMVLTAAIAVVLLLSGGSDRSKVQRSRSACCSPAPTRPLPVRST